METTSFIINITIASVQLFTLIVVAWYSWETHKLRQGQDLLIKQNIERVEPNIIVSFEEGEIFTDIYLEIENIGKQPAYEINFFITPPFDVKDDTYNKYINETGSLSKGLKILKGGSKFKILAADTIETSEYYNKSELITEYTFKITYIDSNNNQYEKICKDSLHKFYTRMQSTEKSSETKSLEEINKTLKEISKNLKH